MVVTYKRSIKLSAGWLEPKLLFMTEPGLNETQKRYFTQEAFYIFNRVKYMVQPLQLQISHLYNISTPQQG